MLNALPPSRLRHIASRVPFSLVRPGQGAEARSDSEMLFVHMAAAQIETILADFPNQMAKRVRGITRPDIGPALYHGGCNERRDRIGCSEPKSWSHFRQRMETPDKRRCYAISTV